MLYSLEGGGGSGNPSGHKLLLHNDPIQTYGLDWLSPSLPPSCLHEHVRGLVLDSLGYFI